MSAAGGFLSEEGFLCSVCLDVFTHPVSTPCGHNFCRACINQYWDVNASCQCPNCKKVFHPRPDLQVNTFISEMVAHFRRETSSGSYDRRRKAEAWKTEAEIQERRRKIREFQRSVEVSRKNADREIEDVEYVFAKLKETVERNHVEAAEKIEEKHRTTEKQAEGFMEELEQEISELEKLSLVQNFKTPTEPSTKNWSEVLVCPPSYEENVRKWAVAQLMSSLKREMKTLHTDIQLKRVRQFAVDVTLDPDTANNELVLSEDGRRVHHGPVEKTVPYNRQRFSDAVAVLGKPSLSSGRFYFEVQVKGKTSWVLGVTRESANRKGLITFTPPHGYWLLKYINDNCRALTESYSVSLGAKPEMVGVFVDYKEGLVSFYDVGAASLIYAFTGGAFTEKLHPFFCPFFHEDGKNSTPLIICPVHQAE